MRQKRSLTIAAMITIAAFAAILFAACSKNKCAGVTCNNGGTCVSGSCSCATGFSGPRCDLIALYYQNNTYTNVSITFNGTTLNVPPGATEALYGTPGTTATGTASTHGLYGNVYSWALSDIFPANGTPFTHQLNVGADYFFLQVSNIDVYPVNYLTVNYGTPEQTVEEVSLQADRQAYGVGYYKWVFNSVIIAKFSDGHSITTDSLSIPGTLNSNILLSLP